MAYEPSHWRVAMSSTGAKSWNAQRRVVRDLEALGVSTRDAKRTLELFESTLAIFDDHLRSLERELL
jgi:hypothetical protein